MLQRMNEFVLYIPKCVCVCNQKRLHLFSDVSVSSRMSFVIRKNGSHTLARLCVHDTDGNTMDSIHEYNKYSCLRVAVPGNGCHHAEHRRLTL